MSGLTVAQKILGRVVGRRVQPGERVEVVPDSLLANEMLGMVIVPKVEQIGAKQIDREIARRTMCFMDHGGVGATPLYVGIHQSMRAFCKTHDIDIEEVGAGICHLLFAEKGGALPGGFVLGTDSHTVNAGAYNTLASAGGASEILKLMVTGKCHYTVPHTVRIELTGSLSEWVYSKDLILHLIGEHRARFAGGRAMEYTGEGVGCMSVTARATASNMAVEAGAVAGVFPCDEILREHVEARFPQAEHHWEGVASDPDAEYADRIDVDLSSLEPTVACPHAPENIRPVREVDAEVDQVFIGSCTNAKYEDLEIVAGILNGRKVRPLTIVVPGTHGIYRECVRNGLLEVFLEAGCRVMEPGCHACFGGPGGLLGPGQRAASTTNRNFIGRMGGDTSTEVYLMSPALAAATAAAGRITHPGELPAARPTVDVAPRSRLRIMEQR